MGNQIVIFSQYFSKIAHPKLVYLVENFADKLGPII